MLDDAPPPTKRMRLHFAKKLCTSANKFNHDLAISHQTKEPEDVRKRKTPQRRPLHILDLNSHVLLEIFQYMDLTDLCNLAEINNDLRKIAERTIALRSVNRINYNHQRQSDRETLKRVLTLFGGIKATITISMNN